MTQQEFGQGFSHCTAKGNLSLFPIIPLPSGQTLRHSQIKTLLFYLLCGKAYVRVEMSQPKNHSGWFTTVTQPIQSHDGSHDVLDQGLHFAVQTQLSLHCLVVCAIVPSHSPHATQETQQVRKFPFMSQDWVFHCCFHGEIHHAPPWPVSANPTIILREHWNCPSVWGTLHPFLFKHGEESQTLLLNAVCNQSCGF